LPSGVAFTCSPRAQVRHATGSERANEDHISGSFAAASRTVECEALILADLND